MKLMITGGSGFVGLAIANAAMAAGNEVAIFADRAPPPRLLEMAGGGKIELHLGDVTDPGDVDGAMQAFGPSHVVHGAALTPSPDKEIETALPLLKINITGAAVVVQAAARAGVERVVSLSSNGVHGAAGVDEGPFDELRTASPESLYDLSKWTGERVALRMGELLGVDVVVTRLGSVYGPFEYESGVRDVMSPQLQMIRAAHAGTPALLAWEICSDWVYSRDAAAGVLTALATPELGGKTFNISGGVRTDMLGWGGLLAQHYPGWQFGVATADQEPNVRYRMMHERASLAIGGFRAASGFEPVFGQERAASDFVRWFQEYKSAV